MEIVASIFKLSAGIGLFLFAMYLIEESLKKLSGRNFKIFLQKITKNRIGAVSGGAIVTGILQSSSMVSLMVLAFVGAGVFTMKNAMAIILGANLGTTLDSWLVATLGFKVNIEVAAYPSICIGGLMLVIFGSRELFKYIAYFLLGFGLLFIGLSYMKTSMESQVNMFDFSVYAQMPLIVFVIIGFIITMLVQSSSVTMALTLSALHAGAIGFLPAAALVLGSEAGTTIKILLSSIGGNASKKRVALGNLLFNIFLTIFAFIFLKPILFVITDIFSIANPLIGLVTFSSFVNLAGIIIFLPFLDPYAKFLERLFRNTDLTAAAYINHANPSEPESAMDLFRRETAYFIYNSMIFNLEQFELKFNALNDYPEFDQINEKRRFYAKTSDEKYLFIKELNGELLSFYLKLRSKLDEKNISKLNQLISSVRSAMYSVKSIHDIDLNLLNLKQSSKDIKYSFFIKHKTETELLYKQLKKTFDHEAVVNMDTFLNIYNQIQSNYSDALQGFYRDAHLAHIEDMDMTIANNFNRELYTSNKAILMALKDFLLNDKDAEAFNEIPIYLT
ncbi:MAG TPA: Na/Pi symporter [Saprospiraceae bacterium]|nr:Na/Pi symporter [Saprospiraceae bacterium]